jgi:hypothetical protein
MDASEQPQSSVRVHASRDGWTTYAIDAPPAALPPVSRHDLDAAWHAAREAALADRWGTTRGFRFRRADGTPLELALADHDARCWARAVDGRVGLHTRYGVSLLLRLLALVDLLARAPWTRALYRLARDGAEINPFLLSAAATAELTDEARFDEPSLRARLAPHALPSPDFAGDHAGATKCIAAPTIAHA